MHPASNGSRRLWRVALLTTSAALVSLVAGECLVRVYVRIGGASAERRLLLFADDQRRHGLPRYQPHPYTAYWLTPGYSWGQTRHNAGGFRGPELTEKPDSSYLRIVAIGESSTYGTTLPNDAQTYPAQLQAILRDRTGIPDIEVVNAGVGGYTSFESVVSLLFRIVPLRPDLIVIYHGANDLHARRATPFAADNTGYRRSWSLREGPWVRVVRHSYLARLVGLSMGVLRPLGVEHYTRNEFAIQREPAPELLREHPPDHFRRNLLAMVNIARAAGIDVVLATFASNPDMPGHYAGWEYYKAGFAEMNRVIRDLAAAENVVLSDVDSMMLRSPELWDDGVHPNAAGARDQALFLARTLLESGLLTRRIAVGPVGAR